MSFFFAFVGKQLVQQNMKLMASILIAIIGVGYVVLAWSGGFMRGFVDDDPLDPYTPSQMLINGSTLCSTIFLIYVLWRPSKKLIVLGSFLIFPLVLFGLIWMLVPAVGLVILTAPTLWYCAAYAYWNGRHNTNESK